MLTLERCPNGTTYCCLKNFAFQLVSCCPGHFNFGLVGTFKKARSVLLGGPTMQLHRTMGVCYYGWITDSYRKITASSIVVRLRAFYNQEEQRVLSMLACFSEGDPSI